VLYNVHVLDANNREVLLDADVEAHKRQKALLALFEKRQEKKKQVSSGWNSEKTGWVRHKTKKKGEAGELVEAYANGLGKVR
jgi:hypothetical protein